MREKTKWLEKYVPLGLDVTSVLREYVVGMIILVFQGMVFLWRYMEARSVLYEHYAGKLVLMEDAKIKDFESLTKGFLLYAILLGVMILIRVIYHYMYHYQGSKMIYLMKRLPDKWELHRRCLTFPIAGAVIWALWGLILRMIYFAIYMLCTPSQCLPL